MRTRLRRDPHHSPAFRLAMPFCLCILLSACTPAPIQKSTRTTESTRPTKPSTSEGDESTTPLDPQPQAKSESLRDLSHEDLDATAWVQTSAEYAAIARQTYRSAERQLAVALANPKWSAWPPQEEQLNAAEEEDSTLPPAVVLDVDETVLDNSPYQSRLIFSNQDYSLEDWNKWVDEKAARAVPGAKEFLTSCREKGIAVFFVTNRTHDVEAPTTENLTALGLRDAGAGDNVLTKREREEWVEAGSDKTPRREFVAKTHRILLLLGDDLNDFVYAGKGPTAAQRRDAAEEYEEYWGVKWFTLPNPDYGGWERALYEFNDRLPRQEKLKRKWESLDAQD